MRSLQGGPIKNLLSECKRRKSSSRGFINGLIRCYHFVSGGKITFYSALLLLPFLVWEVFRKESGPDVLRGLLIPASGIYTFFYLWANATAGGITATLFDELISVAHLVERNVPEELERQTGRIVRIAQFYFWWMAAVCCATILSLVTKPFTSDTLPLAVPLPNSDLIGQLPSDILFVLTSVCQSGFLLYLTMGFGWVDSLFNVAALVIYSLTKLLAESFRSSDYNSNNIFRLINAHQTILKAGQACNEIMSLAFLIAAAVSAYIIVVTGYLIMIECEQASEDRIIDMVVAFVLMIRLGIISDLMMEASLEVATALYQSPWNDALFSNKAMSASNVRHLVPIIMLRAQKPLNLRAGMLGVFNNAFLVKFFKAQYTYFQALQKFAAKYK